MNPKLDVNGKDDHNLTPLYHAACNGDLKMMQLFLEAGASPDTFDSDCKGMPKFEGRDYFWLKAGKNIWPETRKCPAWVPENRKNWGKTTENGKSIFKAAENQERLNSYRNWKIG